MSTRKTAKGTQGRWWLVSERLSEPVSETERALAIASTLLERYGVPVERPLAVKASKADLVNTMRCLRRWKNAGVCGGDISDALGATQFAMPGLEHRLRAKESDSDELVWLSIIDPAQPYGTLFDWPSDFPIRPIRNAGNQVLLRNGEVIAVSHSSGAKLLVRTPDDAAHQQRIESALAQGLNGLPSRLGRSTLFIEHINGETAAAHAIGARLAPTVATISGAGLQIRTVSAGQTSAVPRRGACRFRAHIRRTTRHRFPVNGASNSLIRSSVPRASLASTQQTVCGIV